MRTETSHTVEVKVTDSGGLSDLQSLSVTVGSVNEAPLFTSHDGNATVTLSIPRTLRASLRYPPWIRMRIRIWPTLHGPDSAKFSLNLATGALSFAAAPDYENAEDNDTNNVYEVTVQASDGEFNATQAFSIRVTNLQDNDPVILSNGGGNSAAISLPENFEEQQ